MSWRSSTRVLPIALGLLVAGSALATGFGGSDAPPARIPVPAHDYTAVVEDQSGTRVSVSQVSYNGEVFVYGMLGEGKATVPFETIREVRFEPSGTEGKLVAFIVLKEGGQSVKLLVDSDVPAYGRTAFGTYSITVDKVRKIEFPAS